ncbi:MAG TPA: hypothetical protein VKB59_21765 [Micromonosporaceae bacterium]|nr:hypothetical protein [Micromonosporaceae bacterium]
MLTRRRTRVFAVAGMAVALVVMLGGPAVAAPRAVGATAALPASAFAVAGGPTASVLPDTSVAAATPVRDATLTASPNPAAIPGLPQQAAALAGAPIIAPYLSDLICTYNGSPVPNLQTGCVDPVLGTYDPLDNCFWKALQPPPPPGSPLWGGKSSNSPAAIYTVTCETHNGANVGNAAAVLQYSATPPLNYLQGPLGPVQATALSVFTGLLALAPIPPVGTAPAANAEPGIVGLPNWLWADITPAFWDPVNSGKSVAGSSYAFTFQGMHVDWDMGDGNHVVCATPGTGYHTPAGIGYKRYTGSTPGPSPDCGYTYQIAGTFPVSATVTWLVGFKVTLLGKTLASGTFVISKTTPALLHKIGEAQVVTQ